MILISLILMAASAGALWYVSKKYNSERDEFFVIHQTVPFDRGFVYGAWTSASLTLVGFSVIMFVVGAFSG